MRGRRGRGLVRGMAATAVVAGTAGAVRHNQEKRWARRDAEAYQASATQQQLADQQAQIENLQQQQYAPPPPQYAEPTPAAPPPAESATVQQLQQLAQLRDAGVLSEEEFAAAKQKVLAGG